MKDLSITLSKNQGHLVFTEQTFDDFGIQESLKRGILAIAPDRDPDEVLAKAQELNWKLNNEKDASGFYGVEKVKASKEVLQNA